MGVNAAGELPEARRKRARAIARALGRTYPEATCELVHRSPFELLIATILSAQCTDKMVNGVTPDLFAAYSTPDALGRAPLGRLESLIHRTGFFRQKAKAIKKVGAAVAKDHGGTVPEGMAALTALPGIGRKTANVVRGTAFGLPAVFVDTHVKRLAGRLALTVEDDPVKVERDIQGLLPKTQWTAFCHRLIHHGRKVCGARKPRCEECALARWCPQVGVG
jgi:endonuclease-3